jgi:hypothetical protein
MIKSANGMTCWREFGKLRPEFLDYCRPIFVQQALEDSGFEIGDATCISLWGLPVEIVLAKP